MKSRRAVLSLSKPWLLAACLYSSLPANATSLQCEGVTLSLIDQSARANISIIEGLASDTEIDAALRLPGNLALVEKSNQTGAANTVGDLRTALRAARDGASPSPDLFGLDRLRQIVRVDLDQRVLVGKGHHRWVGVGFRHDRVSAPTPS